MLRVWTHWKSWIRKTFLKLSAKWLIFISYEASYILSVEHNLAAVTAIFYYGASKQWKKCHFLLGNRLFNILYSSLINQALLSFWINEEWILGLSAWNFTLHYVPIFSFWKTEGLWNGFFWKFWYLKTSFPAEETKSMSLVAEDWVRVQQIWE